MEYRDLIFRSKISYIISLLIFSLLLFVINVFIRRLETETIWTLSIAVASLLGVLVTVGAAFATVAAIISYVSVNDKLKLSSDNLKDINEKIYQNKIILDGIDDLVERKNSFQDLYKKLSSLDTNVVNEISKDRISELDSFLLDTSFDESEKEKVHELSQKIINGDYPYQLKIKARLISISILIKGLKEKEDVCGMYHAYSEYEKCCEILFFYDANIINQYLIAIFNKAFYLNKSEVMFDSFNQGQELYRRFIYLSEKHNENIDLRKKAYNNLACMLCHKSTQIFQSNKNVSGNMFDEGIQCFKNSILLDFKYKKGIDNMKKYINARLIILEQKGKDDLKSSLMGTLKSLPQSETKAELIKFVGNLK